MPWWQVFKDPKLQESYADLHWWEVFKDPKLQELIRTALKQNYDLQLATERINAARAQLAVTRSSLVPAGGSECQFQRRQREYVSIEIQFSDPCRGCCVSAGFLRPFATRHGGFSRRVVGDRRGSADGDPDSGQRRSERLFHLAQLDLQLEITHETITTQTDSVKLTKLRLEHGVATKLDVLQAQQVLDTANAQIPDLERQIAQEENAISILLGNYPDAVPRGLALVEQELPPEVPPGLPSSLITRRPDIREAEQNLIAANAEIGVAKAQFFPQIALTGSGGGSFGRSSAFPGTYPSQIGIWSYGAEVSQPIFTGGGLRGNLHFAESQHAQALIAYRQTIQRAFGDVSDTLIDYDKLHQVRLRQQDTVADLQETVHISTLRYQGGTTTYLEVLDSQRSLYTAELTLASARGDEFRSLVQLYRALGGGWQQ